MTTTSDAYCDIAWPASQAAPPTTVTGYVGLKIEPPSNKSTVASKILPRTWTHCQLMVKADNEESAKDYGTQLTRALQALIENSIELTDLKLNELADPSTITSSRKDIVSSLQLRWCTAQSDVEKYKSQLEAVLHRKIIKYILLFTSFPNLFRDQQGALIGPI